MPGYRRTVEELSEFASFFWPAELVKREADVSVIPLLLDSQDQFLAILILGAEDIERLFQIIEASPLSANLFLKHLVVLADVGGEPLRAINSQFKPLFPEGKLAFLWNGEERTYIFRGVPFRGTLDNAKLGISGHGLQEEQTLNDLHKDVIAVLLFAAASTNEKVAEKWNKCEISNYLGRPAELAKFVKERYIWVSRITQGAKANTLGQITQQLVKENIDDNLGMPDVEIKTNTTLPGVSHTDPATNRPTTFDIVVSRGDQHVAVEVSFQRTTNSTIERKAGQARSRYIQIDQAGYKIAYVLDGEGNFQRRTALETICNHSHCTVAFSQDELDVLCQFIREYFGFGG